MIGIATKRRKGRPNITVACDQIPGAWLVKDAVKETGLSYSAIMAGIKRNRPVGRRALMFRRLDPKRDLPPPTQATSNGFSVEPQDPIAAEIAFENHGEEATEICFGKNYVEGERMEVLGITIEKSLPNGFEGVECDVHCIVALMLYRNPLRDELFAACRDVLPRIEMTGRFE